MAEAAANDVTGSNPAAAAKFCLAATRDGGGGDGVDPADEGTTVAVGKIDLASVMPTEGGGDGEVKDRRICNRSNVITPKDLNTTVVPVVLPLWVEGATRLLVFWKLIG